jgi:hypothetical protein
MPGRTSSNGKISAAGVRREASSAALAMFLTIQLFIVSVVLVPWLFPF